MCNLCDQLRSLDVPPIMPPDGMFVNGDWATGILMTDLEHRTMIDLDEEFGLRELRAKIHGRAGLDIGKDGFHNHLSINADFCYGTGSVEIVRKYLNTGVLQNYYDKTYGQDRCWDGTDATKYTVLGACLLTLGCVLPEKMLPKLESLMCPLYQAVVHQRQPDCYIAQMTPLARQQLLAAIDSYQPDRSYTYGNKHRFEAKLTNAIADLGPDHTTTIKDVGSTKVIEITKAGQTLFSQHIGVPSDSDLGLRACYPYNVCGGCGESVSAFRVCSGCKDRKYCSKQCQKKHWKMHKLVCQALSKDAMDQYLESISDIKLQSSTPLVKGARFDVPIGPDHPLNKAGL